MTIIEKIYLAGGCLWGVQYFFKEISGIHHEDADKIRVEVKPLTNYIASALIHQNHLDIYPEDRYLCHLPTAVLNRYRKTQPVQD
ncbi:hypothetical protein ACWOA6_08580 [Globicatella sulfidifaciens]|uniref:hypothetical protein n=1 Tax=Globicatella sulfidifaciens TaxID=136093 RepID=UPI001F1BD2EC|nr:hypothetical protein [Globicatella sulfidifaciens]